ncbi:MAG TPA: DNA repair protein RecO [Candidatus Saccharimonadales bacterium]|nr:DNA repair protein RecO [Candidatus Saccharimonadales bacterium]
MRNFKTEGIIIKRRNYKDADRILTVLTKTHGKIYVKATGVRKITSRRAGHIEPLNHSILSLYQGNAFPVLTEATTINSFSDLKNDLNNIGLALHLCELVDGLCPENQENWQVFDLLKGTLDKLCLKPVYASGQLAAASGTLINDFETRLLSILGYSVKSNLSTVSESDQTGIDRQNFIENILEHRLKSRTIFAKLQ